MIALTFWENLLQENAVKREQELQKNTWSYMLNHGARSIKHDRGPVTAKMMMDKILRCRLTVLQLQAEVIDQDQAISRTLAGQTLLEDAEKMRKRLEKDLKKVRDFKIKMEDSPQVYEVLEEERNVQAQLDDLEARLAGFDASYGSLVTDRESLVENIASKRQISDVEAFWSLYTKAGEKPSHAVEYS